LGSGYELRGIAAAVVGGCSLTGGVGTIPGTVLGVLFLRVVIDAIDKIVKNEAEKYAGLIVGIVVVVAVALTQLRQARRGAMRFFPGALGWVTVVNLAILAGVVAVVMNPSKTVSPARLGLSVGVVTLALLIGVRFLEHRRSPGSKLP
jgi:ABC-type xylose transport system permease subunit